jgi:cytochrome c biogenesis factor
MEVLVNVFVIVDFSGAKFFKNAHTAKHFMLGCMKWWGYGTK